MSCVVAFARSFRRWRGLLISAVALAFSAGAGAAAEPAVRKIRDLVIYEDARFYAAFPSVVRRPDGEVLVAFRRAPARRAFGEPKESHVDPNSYLVLARSRDGAETWREPELMHAFPFGGAQDPCLLQLRDGTLWCASYAWAFIRPEGMAAMRQPVLQILPGVVFLGGFLLRSTDGAATWSAPFYPPAIKPEVHLDAFGKPLRAYNRGALVEGRDGRIFWVVAAHDRSSPRKTSTHLLSSADKGVTWQHAGPVAVDDTVSFNEASVYETRGGDLVAFLRTAQFEDQACIARSKDGGRPFARWEGMGFRGHPLHAVELPDRRVLLTYGYRHPPYGIRARILNAECTDFATAPEIVLRDDGGTHDLGYPWSVVLDDRRVLVVYYFNRADGPRHIAGTLLGIEAPR